jgi:hypothetical protein
MGDARKMKVERAQADSGEGRNYGALEADMAMTPAAA